MSWSIELYNPYLQLKRMLGAKEQVEVHGLGVVQLPHLLGSATVLARASVDFLYTWKPGGVDTQASRVQP